MFAAIAAIHSEVIAVLTGVRNAEKKKNSTKLNAKR
jgi:hypothetical protein